MDGATYPQLLGMGWLWDSWGNAVAQPGLTGPHIVIMFYFFFKLICLFIFGCTGSLLLPVGFLSSSGKQAVLLVVVHGLLIAKASVVAEHRLWGVWATVVVAHGPSWPMACGIFLNQGFNLGSLTWQADS